ncbi:MAG: polymer-forming cytoskeletal protein [Lachnospiraceae bacterium]|nr:polymer-forming cytoskeletal protein [Lachnospiraceae bacterium]
MKKSVAKIGTIIGKGNIINGDFQAAKSVRLDGEIDGNVTVGGLLVIGSAGKINGNVEAAAAIVGGEVTGDITAPDKIEITETARVIGNLRTNVIVIDEKAIFQGQLDMYQEEMPAKPKRRPLRESKAVRKTAKDALKEALREVDAEVNQQEDSYEEME